MTKYIQKNALCFRDIYKIKKKRDTTYLKKRDIKIKKLIELEIITVWLFYILIILQMLKFQS